MNDEPSRPTMWTSLRGPYGCGICGGDVVRYRGHLYVAGGLGVTLHGGYCSYSLIPIGEAPRVLSENGFDATIDVSALEFVVSARDAEWQKLREFAP